MTPELRPRYWISASPGARSKKLVAVDRKTKWSKGLSSAEVSRSVTTSAVYSRSGLASPTTILDKRKAPDGFVNSQRSDSVCLSVCRERFSIPLQAIPKTDLSTFVLDLMIYLMSMNCVLCLILCLMSF